MEVVINERNKLMKKMEIEAGKLERLTLDNIQLKLERDLLEKKIQQLELENRIQQLELESGLLAEENKYWKEQIEQMEHTILNLEMKLVETNQRRTERQIT